GSQTAQQLTTAGAQVQHGRGARQVAPGDVTVVPRRRLLGEPPVEQAPVPALHAGRQRAVDQLLVGHGTSYYRAAVAGWCLRKVAAAAAGRGLSGRARSTAE